MHPPPRLPSPLRADEAVRGSAYWTAEAAPDTPTRFTALLTASQSSNKSVCSTAPANEGEDRGGSGGGVGAAGVDHDDGGDGGGDATSVEVRARVPTSPCREGGGIDQKGVNNASDGGGGVPSTLPQSEVGVPRLEPIETDDRTAPPVGSSSTVFEEAK